MRSEQQLRDRLDRLIRECETLRQQCARLLLSDKAEDWESARDTMLRLRDTQTTIRAIDWALGQRP